MKNNPFGLRNLIRVTVFASIPFLLVLLMYVRTSDMLHGYFETQVIKSADLVRSLASQKISTQMKDLEHIAGYFRDGAIPEEQMPYIMDRFLVAPDRISGGILRLNGEPVSGEKLSTSEYIAVQNAFRGNPTVTYRKNEGLLFTYPIYYGENVQYSLYGFYDPEDLFADFNQFFYEGNGQLVLVDSEKMSVFPITPDLDVNFFYESKFEDIYREMNRKMGNNTSAAVFTEQDRDKEIFFVSKLDQDNLYILGTIPYYVVEGRIRNVVNYVLVVYFILLLLLFIGTFSILNANYKIKESEALKEAKQLAEEASKSKSTFIANMSHELRTPINVILGMDEMILREENSRETRERAMDIRSAAQILLGLINDVLDFSKIESGKMTIINAEYDLAVMLRDLTLLTENRARQKSLSFELKIQPDLPSRLYGDDVHIRQVMTNLLTNAVKYTPDGKVTLVLNGEMIGEDKVRLHCEVVDTGMGIKKEDIEKLMIPYTRVAEETTRTVEGTGLGMSIITNLLKLMDSKLQIESEFGVGSTFSFDLEQKVIDKEPVGDIRKRMADMVKDYEYKVSFTAPKAKIMMVDDNSMNRTIFTNLLKKTKVSLLTVSSGRKALELTAEERFDLIFMDFLMPEMNGYEAMLGIKNQENGLCNDVPVIALTANAFNGDREKYMEMGFDEFLAKPIVTEKLENLIRTMLPQDYIEEAEEEEDSSAGEEEDFPAIEGVNWDYASLHLKDRNLLMQSLREYYRNLTLDKKEILNLYSGIDTEEGLNLYRIQVHSLKGVSAMMGVLSVSELAKLLEKAAKEGDRERIHQLNFILIDEMDKTKERLAPYMEKEEEKLPPPDPSELTEMLEGMIHALEEMDIGDVDSRMEELRKFAFEEPVAEIIGRLDEKVTALDFDGAMEEVQSLRDYV